MTPNEFKSARRQLGLTQAGLAEALLVKGGGRTVRRWESSEIPIPGPVKVAITMMIEKIEMRLAK